MLPAMGARRKGQVLALAIGLAPVILVALTWSPRGPEPWMILARSYALPVLVVEIATILTALFTGLVDTIRRIRLPKSAAVAAAVLMVVMVGTGAVRPRSPGRGDLHRNLGHSYFLRPVGAASVEPAVRAR